LQAFSLHMGNLALVIAGPHAEYCNSNSEPRILV
jgi:hypothetical protein